MLDKIIAFFMSVITFICGLFGFDCCLKQPVETEKSYVYSDFAYGKHERQILDLYVPKNTDGEAGLILFIHGGAWVAGDKDGYRSQLEYYCEEYGYVAAAINYRYLATDVSFGDMLDDIGKSLYVIKCEAQKVGVTVNKMITTGGSAGGHLAMLYAYARKDTSPVEPVAVLNYCGPTDMCDPNFYNENATEALRNLYLQIASLVYGSEITMDKIGLVQEKFAKYSPINYIDENTVPTVINHGMVDDIVPYSNALALDAKLTEYGVTHILNPYPNSGHGLDNDSEAQALADKYFLEYVQTYLK